MSTDIPARSWIRFLPSFLRPYAVLMRLDRPAGFWLLVFPAWWALALAAPLGQGPDAGLMLLFLIGAILMRAAGCIINDLFDYKMDARVARTAARPLSAGTVTPLHAMLLAGALTLLGLLIVLTMNGLTLLLAVITLPLIAGYPLMKRITWWPQAFLGLVFNFGVLMGTAAALNALTPASFVLYAACFFWTLGYDTIYAAQDVEDDATTNIKSTARFFGAAAPKWVGFFYGMCWLLLVIAGFMHGLGLGFYIGMALAMREFIGQIRGWHADDPVSSLAMFKSNVIAGAVILFALVAGHYF